jgi:hypothetical protein
MTIKKATCPLIIATCLAVGLISVAAETPGEFRPHPTPHPAESGGAKGTKIQPRDTYPVSRAPLVNDARRKPKLADPGQPVWQGRDLVFNAGWEMIEAPKIQADGTILSQPGVDTHDWYDATVPGTVLTTLVDQGVYPDPYYGLNNLLIPESLNKQDYWYRNAFALPEKSRGSQLTLQFNGINYYAEVWFNGVYLGHITGAFIRGRFDVTRLAKPGATNVVAVMVVPPPDPGIPSEESVKYGPGENGGALCLDGPTFACSEGWDWIPAIRDRDTGIWQDVILRATGPVTLGDPQVTIKLPLPDTSRADVAVRAELHNHSEAIQQGTVRGSFEGVTFEQPVTLAAGETKTVGFTAADFPQLTVDHPRLWWPNGYGKPELYHLKLSFMTADGQPSDDVALRFGVREMSYEFAAKKPDGTTARVEYTPILLPGTAGPVIDNRRDTMVWGRENKARRDQALRAAGKKVPTTPYHWGQGQDTTVGLYPAAENSPAVKPANDPRMGRYLVIMVNGRRIETLGGSWGMDDALKRVSRARLEPYIRMTRDANLNLIRNWAGQSTSETFYDLCDEYGIMVWNEFWENTEGWNYNPVDEQVFLANAEDTLKRFRNHPSIALWCPRNEGVPTETVHDSLDRMIRTLDGTRYYQPNSRLINMRNSGPWSNLPLAKYFNDLNQGFSTEIGASSIPSAETMRSFMPAADLWPLGDVWAYHDFHSVGAGGKGPTLERMTTRYGAPRDLEDICRKAQMLNYETYRAIYEGFNSRLWNDCSGVVFWMSQPSWPSTLWQLYSWNYDPNASLFGAKKGAEPVHIQMNEPDCQIAVINRTAAPLTDVTASAKIYSLTGEHMKTSTLTLTAPPDACTPAYMLDWPGGGAYLVKLELRDRTGKLLSQNFYWHARNEQQLQSLNSLPQVALTGQWHVEHSAHGLVAVGNITNPTKTPVLETRLTLRDAKTRERILPAYYDDNYISLLPGETRNFRIESSVTAAEPEVDLSGWNVVSARLD